jgi:hypothetical protein
MPDYALNQRTDACEKSPIDGCNLFVNVRDTVACFECKKEYRLVDIRLVLPIQFEVQSIY